MGWDEIYQDMAFSPFKTEYARTRQLHDALVTLHSYMQGQARDYELQDALAFLEKEFGRAWLWRVRRSGQQSATKMN